MSIESYQMLIDGDWVDASDGKRFSSHLVLIFVDNVTRALAADGVAWDTVRRKQRR